MLDVEQVDGVAVVRMAHGRVNAMDLELLAALRQAITRAAGQPLVLTGSGSCFSAGVDLRRIVAEPSAYTAQFLTELSAVFLAAFRHPRPVVAAVNGHALAGGCVLALAADHRLMAGGTIGLTELRVGVPFPTAAVEIVRYAVGGTAGRLALTGDALDVDEALRLGLVQERCPPDEVVPRGVARAVAMAAGRPEAYAATKRQLHAEAERAIARDSAADDAETLRQWSSVEARTAITGFLDRLAHRG